MSHDSVQTNEVTRQYKPGEHPNLPPPISAHGPMAWMRENLFSSVGNGAVTLLCLFILVSFIPDLFMWMIGDAVLNASSISECRNIDQGACWAVIKERYLQFIYYTYPEQERWRVNLCFGLLIVALIPILYDKTPARKYALLYSLAFPFIAAWLLVGGFGLEPVSTDKFGGFMLTFVIGVTGIAFSLPIGILLALGRQSKMPIIHYFCVFFIEFIRGVPLIAILFIAIYMLKYFIPPESEFNNLLRVLIMVTLFAAAYIAETIRGGLQSLPKGQAEAAKALGLNYWKATAFVILPQALKVSIPGIMNIFIGLFKETTLVSIIGLYDPVGLGKSAILADQNWIGADYEVYLFISLVFFIFCFLMSRYSLYLERKLDTGHKR